MAKVHFPKIMALTLFVPAAMAKNKGFLLASEYRKRTGVRLSPKSIRVVPTDSAEWLVEERCWNQEIQRTEPNLPAAPIPADVRSAMVRRWRQGALGLRS
ncbi:MAG: hypothetical protein GF334_09430 [Candidatus Altiarchaeales archaeon]|nr:hypothetical protein [Candidatus Altiarchaeales archaeon]